MYTICKTGNCKAYSTTVHVQLCVCVCVCVWVDYCACAVVCVCVCVCVHACACVCVCLLQASDVAQHTCQEYNVGGSGGMNTVENHW